MSTNTFGTSYLDDQLLIASTRTFVERSSSQMRSLVWPNHRPKENTGAIIAPIGGILETRGMADLMTSIDTIFPSEMGTVLSHAHHLQVGEILSKSGTVFEQNPAIAVPCAESLATRSGNSNCLLRIKQVYLIHQHPAEHHRRASTTPATIETVLSSVTTDDEDYLIDR